MAGRTMLALLLFLVITAKFGLGEEIINDTGEIVNGPEDITTDNADEIQGETNLSDDFSFEDGILDDEMSKRSVDTASKTFAKLKSTFVTLGKPKPKPRLRINRFGSRNFWGWRRRTRGSRPTRFRFFRTRRPTVTRARNLDIVFVMDKSGSIGSHNFELEKDFVENLIEYYDIFPAKTRVAIVTYSTSVKLEFNFNKNINKECLRKGIEAIRYTGGLTATGSALQYVHNSLIFNAAAGARSSAKKVVFVLTDGRSNIGVAPSTPSGQLKRAGVIIFAMGVTHSIRNKELREIATSSSHVFHVANYAALNQVTQKIKGDLSKKCINGRTVYDTCGRKCTCQNGKLVKCCRRRREFTDLSYTERVRYINTVKKASTDPAYKSQYDSLLTLHKTIFPTEIHELDFFLPWHRWFILQYENLLQQIDCRVTVPYWDWSLVGGNPFSSSVWSTGNNGFGGNGVPGGSCVNTGPFRQGVWSLPASSGGGCLRRNFFGTVPDEIAVQTLISSNSNPSNFLNFEQMLRIQFHDLVHCVIDGTMCTTDAASAPEFFLHHGFVDKIWWDWQKQSNTHKFNTYFTTQTKLMTSTPYRSRDFLDLNNQPGCVCAEYENPRKNIAFRRLKAMTKTQLKSIARLPLPPLSSKAARLFRTSPAQIRLASRLRAKLQPTQVATKSSLRGTDAILGMKLSSVTPVRRTGSKSSGRIAV